MDSKIYDILEDRIIDVLVENGERGQVGIAKVIMNQVTHNAYVDVEVLYEFAERYNVSIDWLLGRIDKNYL